MGQSQKLAETKQWMLWRGLQLRKPPGATKAEWLGGFVPPFLIILSYKNVQIEIQKYSTLNSTDLLWMMTLCISSVWSWINVWTTNTNRKTNPGATKADRLCGFVPPQLKSRPRIPLHMPRGAHTRLFKVWYENNHTHTHPHTRMIRMLMQHLGGIIWGTCTRSEWNGVFLTASSAIVIIIHHIIAGHSGYIFCCRITNLKQEMLSTLCHLLTKNQHNDQCHLTNSLFYCDHKISFCSEIGTLALEVEHPHPTAM